MVRALELSPLAGEGLGRGGGGPCACRASPLIRPSGTFSPPAGRRKARGSFTTRLRRKKSRGRGRRGVEPLSPRGRGVGERGSAAHAPAAHRPSSALRAPSPRLRGEGKRGVIHDADDAEKRREVRDDAGVEPLSPRGRGVGERGRWPMRLPHIAPYPPFGHLLPAGGEKESAGVIHDADDVEKRREAQDDTGVEPLSPRGRGVGERRPAVAHCACRTLSLSPQAGRGCPAGRVRGAAGQTERCSIAATLPRRSARRCSSARRLARTAGSSALTMTLSKKVSTSGRSRARRPSTAT